MGDAGLCVRFFNVCARDAGVRVSSSKKLGSTCCVAHTTGWAIYIVPEDHNLLRCTLRSLVELIDVD